MDDSQFQYRIREICQHPDDSPKRRRLITRLFVQLQKHPRIIKSSHPNYLDALNRTWEWFGQNLCKTFDNRDFTTEDLFKWINSYLYWRIKDLAIPEKPLSLHEVIVDRSLIEEVRATVLTGIDGYLEQARIKLIEKIGLELEHYIERDPFGKLQQCHIRNNPHCNCQFLAQRRILKEPPDKFLELARELNTSQGSLTSHWHRKCLPLLQEIAKDLGYQPDE